MNTSTKLIRQKQTRKPIADKLRKLESNIKSMESVIVAYSGGIDSTFLAAYAQKVLGNRVLAVTASSPSLPLSELDSCVDLARQLRLNHRVIQTNEVNRPEYQANSPSRCFFCKDELYLHLLKIADQEHYMHVANGTNCDDLGDFRPGLSAAKRHNISSPLVDAGLTKQDIRNVSKKMGLPNWNKPAQACLASRIPYGTRVSPELLLRISNAEAFLNQLGLNNFRVRHHNSVARIEVPPSEFGLLIDDEIRGEITKYFRSIGYTYITLDLDGFRSGSLNEPLEIKNNHDSSSYGTHS